MPKNFLIYNYEDWTVSQNYDLDKLNELYAAQSSIVSDEEIYTNSPILNDNPLYRYRGKYELTCLVKFMLEIQAELKIGKGGLIKKPYSNQITNHQVLSMWAQYTDEDEKLKEYMIGRIKSQ